MLIRNQRNGAGLLDHGRRPSEGGAPLVRELEDWRRRKKKPRGRPRSDALGHIANHKGNTSLGYFVEMTSGDTRCGTAVYGVFRGHYDADLFFDPILIRGGFTSEAEAEHEAQRLAEINGVVIDQLVIADARLNMPGDKAHALFRGRQARAEAAIARLEREDELQERCLRLARRVRELLRALARKQRAMPAVAASALHEAAVVIDAETA